MTIETGREMRERERERLAAPVQLVESVPLQFDDIEGLRKATLPRNEDDYQPQKLRFATHILPVNVLRSLANEESIENLREVAIKANIPDLHLAIVKHRIVTQGEPYPIPLHFVTAFTHPILIDEKTETVRVAGSIFVSSLHSILESPILSVEQKVRTTEGILSEYIDQAADCNVSVISMPKRKYQDHSFEIKPENSLTHTLLLRACKSLDHYRERGNSGLYFLAHTGKLNEAKREVLFNDESFLDKTAEIGSVWSTNFQREIQKSETSELGKKQKEDMVETLVNSYS